MKNIEVVKSCEVELKPFVLSDFTHHEETRNSEKSISKKALKHLARKAGLTHTDDQIDFAKKIIAVYLEQK